ncbi:MAG: YCF48-related protein [Planctomycetaceae bacterium]|nr:YCF48-related protein [Planctomycetaceae bacterium]
MLTPLRSYTAGLLFLYFFGISSSIFAQNAALPSIIEELKLSKTLAKQKASAPQTPNYVPSQFDGSMTPQPGRMRDPFEQMAGGGTPEFDNGIRETPEFSGEFTPLQTQEQRFKAELQADARLNDICFTDARCGFAVGDHGTLWKTVDGGRNWVLANTPVDCSLYSVSFSDPMRGVVAGGFRIPYLNKSEGVLLKTDDGGETWHRVSTPGIPLLRHVKMENRSYGYAAGESSGMSQGGLFQTQDGGRSWNPIPGLPDVGWNDFHFLDPQTGAGLASDGSLRIMQGTIRLANHLPFGLRRPLALDLFDRAGWLVGEGGLVQTSQDYGENWNPLLTPPPGKAASQFDFQAVFARENNVWIAGTPGSVIYYSRDAGRTWNSSQTGVTTPIREIRFFDPTRGYAVGDLGVILETLDGGVHWTVQRLGGSRLAMLGVYMKSEEIPLESLVLYGREYGYLCGVNIVSQSDENPIDAVHEAVVRSGGVSATQSWGFTLDPVELKMPVAKVVERINRENGGEGLLRFRQNLVRNIRMWKPNVITTSDPRSGDSASRQFLAKELAEAIRAAADPNIFPEQIHEVGLTPWKVGKLSLVSKEFQGEVNHDSGDYAARIGRSLEESTFGARGLIQPNPSQWFSRTGYQAIVNDLTNVAGTKNDLMSGITLAPGAEARRIPLGNAADQAETNRKQVQRRHQILRLCDSVPQGQGTDSNLNTVAVLGTLLQEMNPVQIPELLLEVGLRFKNQNRRDDTEAVFMRMVEQFPQHPYTVVALQWLVRYNASEEIRWWSKRKSGLNESNPLDFTRQELLRAEYVKQFSRLLKMHAPEEYAAMQRKSNSSAMISATKAAEPPYLDGLFDEELDQRFWYDAPIVSFTPKSGPIQLVSGQQPVEPQGFSDLGTQAMFRYDDDNLYMAFRCRKSNGFTYPPPDNAPRPRDPDLSGEDRVEIFLDTDGDAAVAFKLTVDYRGWVAEDCWGDKSWNPTLYVAREEDDQFWMIEAAIPLDQLTEYPPQQGTAWGISLRRIVPGVGIENFSQEPGVLRFE